jgi:hypothetical protein
MTNLNVHSNSPDQTPVAGVKDRLTYARDAAAGLAFDARYLALEVRALLTDLNGIAETPTAWANVFAALDAAAWARHALENVGGELNTLKTYLDDAVNAA